MYPILFQWNQWILPTWHVMFVLAAFCGYFYMQRLRKAAAPEISARTLDSLFVIVYVAGFIGARLFSFFTDEPLYEPHVQVPLWHILLPGPMTFYGGALAGFGAGLWFCLWNKVSKASLLDCVIPAVLLALFIGRIGCFLNGDDFGLPVPIHPGEPVPWFAVTFPNHPVPIPRYPVQLFESGASLLLVFVCIACRKRNLPKGWTGILGLMGYAVARFFLEYLRGDPRGWVIDQVLSPAQLVSILIFVIGLARLF